MTITKWIHQCQTVLRIWRLLHQVPEGISYLNDNKKVLLLLDMCKVHLFNLEFMEYINAHNVEVCSFPPHCTHVLQPLDDIPFAHFKNEYQKELLIMNIIANPGFLKKKHTQGFSKTIFFLFCTPPISITTLQLLSNLIVYCM